MLISIIILGIIQGLTEFLPISSSGHLVIGKALLGIRQPDATMEIFLHLGTLIAIIYYYRGRIWIMLDCIIKRNFNTSQGIESIFILWASIPAAVVGILLGEIIESLFSSPSIATIMLIFTGLLLISTHWIRQQRNNSLGWLNTFAIGIAQAIAILPGISRSGITITTALWSGIGYEKSAEFSFLLAIPAISGAIMLKIIHIIKSGICPSLSLLVGVIVSAIVGYISLIILIPILKRGKFWMFGIYCIIIGITGTIILTN
ncbi:undecaprenyl-diphosphate phosphatase [bacterium]|nr:MAG: undecaprenyl-diphosphate phosphatase [bacterium]